MADQLDRERIRTHRIARLVLNLVALYLLLPLVGLALTALAAAVWGIAQVWP